MLNKGLVFALEGLKVCVSKRKLGNLGNCGKSIKLLLNLRVCRVGAEYVPNGTHVHVPCGDTPAGIYMNSSMLALERTMHGWVSYFDTVGCAQEPK